MTAQEVIPKGESHVVRLFSLDMPREQVRFLREEPAAIADILGVEAIDPAHVDIIRISDLDDLGLTGYLTDGCGVPETEIAPDLDRLRALDGHAMVVLSRAFGEGGQHLHPSPKVELVATYGQPGTDWSGGTLTAESALPRTGKVPPRQARAEARRIGGALFAVFMVLILLVVGVLIW